MSLTIGTGVVIALAIIALPALFFSLRALRRTDHEIAYSPEEARRRNYSDGDDTYGDI